MQLYSTELVGIHPLLALSITIGPNILFSIIIHSLELEKNYFLRIKSEKQLTSSSAASLSLSSVSG